jgi:virginiamycin B lyase
MRRLTHRSAVFLTFAGALLVVTVAGATTAAPKVRQVDVNKAGAKEIRITGDWLAAGRGGIWLSGMEEIYRLNPRNGRRQAKIPVPQEPCQATDVGAGALWTATCGVPGLAKIDTKRNRVARHVAIPVSTDYFGEGSIGVGAGAVWLVTDGPDCTTCRVSRVDPRSMEVTAEIPVRIGAAAVRVGVGSVWVTNPVEDVVQRIDPAAGQVTRTIKTARGPRFFDVGKGAAWTLDQIDGTVTRVDAETNRTVRIGARVRGEGGDLTVGGGFVWARGTDQLLTQIDPNRRKVVARYGPSSGSGAVIVGGGAVWISAHDVNTVWRMPLYNRRPGN